AIMAEVVGSEYEGIIEAQPDCPASGFVVHTFRWVLHILLQTSEFAEVVQKAANLGEHSDTIGAIAGGLAGNHYGHEGIPARYAEAILIKDRLDEIISHLYALKSF
ncbi:ADP-ribosyl-[dinitrogen reductase] hydrolase, partial [Clostridium perfringens]